MEEKENSRTIDGDFRSRWKGKEWHLDFFAVNINNNDVMLFLIRFGSVFDETGHFETRWNRLIRIVHRQLKILKEEKCRFRGEIRSLYFAARPKDLDPFTLISDVFHVNRLAIETVLSDMGKLDSMWFDDHLMILKTHR